MAFSELSASWRLHVFIMFATWGDVVSSLHEAKLTPKHPKKHSPTPVGELLPLKKSYHFQGVPNQIPPPFLTDSFVSRKIRKQRSNNSHSTRPTFRWFTEISNQIRGLFGPQNFCQVRYGRLGCEPSGPPRD